MTDQPGQNTHVYLAELLGLLHDLGKLSQTFIESEPGKYPHRLLVNPNTALPEPGGSGEETRLITNLRNRKDTPAPYLERADLTECLKEINLSDSDGTAYNLAELVLLIRPRYAQVDWALALGKKMLPAKLLSTIHAILHYEKEETGKLGSRCNYLCSPFGYETPVALGQPDEDNSALGRLPLNRMAEIWHPEKRQAWLEAMAQEMRRGPADNRRPLNEVRLWDWGYTAASLAKGAARLAAGPGWPEDATQWPEKLAWKTLSICLDSLACYLRVEKISDLLGIQAELERAYTQVRKILEVDQALGNLYYQDEHGAYYLVPDVELPGCLVSELREAFPPDLIPLIQVGAAAKGHELDPDHQTSDPEVVARLIAGPRLKAQASLEAPIRSGENLADWQAEWNNTQEREVCTVCGLRPASQDSKRKGICTTCHERRIGRARTWARQELEKTIWVDEAADENGRLALLVGEFELQDWLNGKLVQTLRLDPDEPKKASPARLYRIWQAAAQFWQEVEQDLAPQTVPRRQERIAFIPRPGTLPTGLGEHVTYELGEEKLGVLWDSDTQRWISIENLAGFQRRSANGSQLSQLLHHPGGRLTIPVRLALYEPSAYAQASQVRGEVEIERIERLDGYTPIIPILRQPEKMLLLLPARYALPLVKAIEKKYLEELGKVRDRLPIHIGLVFFPRRTPIRAVLEAGQAMFRMDSRWEAWRVAGNRLDDTGRDLLFANGISWQVKTRMGDNLTRDEWYPFFISSNPDSQADLFMNSKHVSHLVSGETTWVRPSYFDFEFLDAAGRRFEIAYDSANRRLNRLTRPYYLAELAGLEEIWVQLNQLERSQIYDLVGAVEETRQRWGSAVNDPVFVQFASDCLAEANWHWRGFNEEQRNRLVQAAVTGRLADIVEIHLHILKEKELEG